MPPMFCDECRYKSVMTSYTCGRPHLDTVTCRKNPTGFGKNPVFLLLSYRYNTSCLFVCEHHWNSPNFISICFSLGSTVVYWRSIPASLAQCYVKFFEILLLLFYRLSVNFATVMHWCRLCSRNVLHDTSACFCCESNYRRACLQLWIIKLRVCASNSFVFSPAMQMMII